MSTPLTHEDIRAFLEGLGLGAGDAVLLHSSMASLGPVEGGAECVISAFLDVLGPAGTLVVPIFGDLGVITRLVRERADAVCSIHPRAAVAAVGAQAEALCADHWKAELAHGAETPYTRLADLGGYVCLLGVDQDRNTSLHTVEELLRLPYLRATPPLTFQTPEGEVTRSWPFFPGPHRDFIGLDRLLREEGHMRLGHLGKATVRLISSAELLRVGQRAGTADSAFALCANPHCDDCRTQRADLRRARLARESFTLVVAASLAGHYAEEIADHCLALGLKEVELDCVYGKPVTALHAKELTRALDILREAGCHVGAVRLPAPPDTPLRFFTQMREHGVDRVLMPLSAAAREQLRQASATHVQLAFYNLGISGSAATALLRDMDDQGFQPGFVFSARGFARVGEKPFLQSWALKLKRYVVQLDLEDLCFDGTAQPLGEGHGEIKELISILRCAGFSGHMVLGQGNRSVGTLADAVTRFETLLAQM